MKSRSFKAITTLVAVICTIAMLSSLAFAVPAAPTQLTLSQPSGEKFTATKHGDETSNWLTADDGSVIIQSSDKSWQYGELQNGKLVATGKKFKVDAKPSKVLKNADMVKGATKADLSTGAQLAVTPNTGTQPLLVVLVDFSDISMIYADDLWRNSFYGGVNAYYAEASHGKFQFSAVNETYGTANDGIIHVKLNYAHPNTAGNTGTANQQIVKDALTAADPYINYAAYDTNRNGSISYTELHLAFVIAGYEAAYDNNTPAIWAHRWATSGKTATALDGVKVANGMYGGGYVQQGERHGDHMATIGTLCHELGHDISLPDLYDTDYTSDGIGVHSIMAAGSWARVGTNPYGSSPTHFDAYCKTGLGWITPVTVATGTNTYTVNAAYLASENILKVPTSSSTEYFLIQNRQFKGYDAALTYDCAAGSDGILILHIDTGVSSNANEARKLVDVEEANQGTLGYSQLDTAQGYGTYQHYYKSGFNTTFGPATTPNSKLNTGVATNITISVPGTASDAMSVTVTK